MDIKTQEILNQVIQRLDVVIALLLKSTPNNPDGLALKDQIKILDDLGVRPIDIAKITGKKPGHVSKELVAIRRKS